VLVLAGALTEEEEVALELSLTVGAVAETVGEESALLLMSCGTGSGRSGTTSDEIEAEVEAEMEVGDRTEEEATSGGVPSTGAGPSGGEGAG
jgi:hypothetical protein